MEIHRRLFGIDVDVGTHGGIWSDLCIEINPLPATYGFTVETDNHYVSITYQK